jgi:zinc transport system substrate-binding protein
LSRAVAALLLFAAACASGSGEDTTAVTTAYPLTWLVQEIAPDFDVESLSSHGQDPHDMELTPQQRAGVERAGLVVYLGDIDFQPQVEAAMGSAQGEVVSAAAVIGQERLLRTPDGVAVDPHFWFAPALLAEVAEAVRTAAAAANPAQDDAYTANYQRVMAELDQLDTEVSELLSSCRHDQVVVGHEAFAYLLEPHGLTQHGISGAGGHSEASPRDISALAAKVRELGLPAVLSEPVEGRTDAEAVAREAGVEVVEILSLDIVEDEDAQRGYPALLIEQAQAVARAAGCGR